MYCVFELYYDSDRISSDILLTMETEIAAKMVTEALILDEQFCHHYNYNSSTRYCYVKYDYILF